MRTFEFDDGKSRKFWNIDLQGSRFTVAWGRLGTQGQTQTKEFADAAKAQAAFDKLVKEKLGKGYVETSVGAAAAAPTAKALENALTADPDDLAAHAAYADFLAEQGDPRGEFIQVQLALEDPARPAKERKPLQEREQALLKAHSAAWLGELEQHRLDPTDRARYALGSPTYEYQFARGWLDSLHLPRLTVAVARVLARSPALRLLRRLVIEQDVYQEPGDYEAGDDIPEAAAEGVRPGLYPLVRSPFLGNVKVLQLGEQVGESGYSNSQINGEAAVDLVKKMPGLEELYLLARNVDTEALFKLKTLTRLRVLQVYHQREYRLDVLARNAALAQLTHLLFMPHMLEPGADAAYISFAGVRALVRSPHLPRLTHLQLRLSDLGDQGCQEIVGSGILSHLKVLDLRHGRITDAGARTLAGCADLRRLELLDISRNMLTDEGIAALSAVGIKLESDNQHLATGYELDYLAEGDME